MRVVLGSCACGGHGAGGGAQPCCGILLAGRAQQQCSWVIEQAHVRQCKPPGATSLLAATPATHLLPAKPCQHTPAGLFNLLSHPPPTCCPACRTLHPPADLPCCTASQAAMADGAVTNGTLSQSERQAKSIWRIREGISEALVRHGRLPPRQAGRPAGHHATPSSAFACVPRTCCAVWATGQQRRAVGPAPAPPPFGASTSVGCVPLPLPLLLASLAPSHVHTYNTQTCTRRVHRQWSHRACCASPPFPLPAPPPGLDCGPLPQWAMPPPCATTRRGVQVRRQPAHLCHVRAGGGAEAAPAAGRRLGRARRVGGGLRPRRRRQPAPQRVGAAGVGWAGRGRGRGGARARARVEVYRGGGAGTAWQHGGR